MKFSEFQATGRDVPDLRAFPHIAAQLGLDLEGVDSPIPGRVYLDNGLFIQRETFSDGEVHWFVTISNGGSESLHLVDCERELYEFAVSEGYIEGPTTEEELIEALQGLLNYVGGWDAPAGHPCRVAADLLARLS
jgi:hypothetical protein